MGSKVARAVPTNELHSCQLQVPAGAAQVGQGLHEKLVVATRVALHLGEKKVSVTCFHLTRPLRVPAPLPQYLGQAIRMVVIPGWTQSSIGPASLLTSTSGWGLLC